jgi:hypothetical protein
VRNTVFVILHLFKGHRNGFGENIVMISRFKIFPHKGANRIKKLGRNNDIPMLAMVSFFPVKMVNIGLVQEDDVSGMQCMGLSVEGMGNGTFQNIENLIEPVAVDDFITVFRNFGVKWL